jgi:AI-2 transport protein TqsA
MDAHRDEQRLLMTVSMLVVASVAFTVALIYTRSLMVPFVLAVLVSYLVSPLVDILQLKARSPRSLAVLGAFLTIGALFALLALVIAQSVAGLEANSALYQERLVGLAAQLQAWLDGHGIDMGQTSVIEKLESLPIFGFLQGAAGGAVGFVTNLLLVLIFSVYMVTGRKPQEVREGLGGAIDHKVRRYIITKVLTSSATGFLVGLILGLFGLDLALVFGLMAFLLNFIPSLGSVVATLLPLPIALVQMESALMVSMVIVIPGVVQLIIGNVIEPKLMGESLDLHPITILLALIFWGLIWGIVGMLLASPITAVFKIILERYETTRPMASILAGRGLG